MENGLVVFLSLWKFFCIAFLVTAYDDSRISEGGQSWNITMCIKIYKPVQGERFT